MTVKVAGVWERGWFAPITELDLWRYPLRDFGVDEFIMTPVTGVMGKVTELPLLESAINGNSHLSLVFLDEKGATDLQEFEHPKDCLYVLGRAGYSPLRALGSLFEHQSVKIEFSTGRLWPHQAISLTLYDRALKHGRNHNRQ